MKTRMQNTNVMGDSDLYNSRYLCLLIYALLKNMETQRFKIQLATGFFAAANHDDYHNNTAP